MRARLDVHQLAPGSNVREHVFLHAVAHVEDTLNADLGGELPKTFRLGCENATSIPCDIEMAICE